MPNQEDPYLYPARQPIPSWLAMFGAMLEYLEIGIAVLDDQGHIRHRNPMLATCFAETLAPHKPIWEVLLPEDRATLRAALQRLKDRPDTEYCTLYLPGTKLNETIFDAVLGRLPTVAPEAEAELSGDLCWLLRRRNGDLNEATRLQAERARLSRVVDNIPYGIMEIDCNGSICFGNRALHRIFGYEEGELHGEGIWLILEDEQEKRRFSRELAHILTDEPEPGPLFPCGLHKDGNSVSLRIDWTYLRGLDGGVNGLLIVVTDITRQQAEEAERERLRRELQQAQKMEALGQLTGGIAHDFNNMLAGIMGYAELTLENLHRADSDTLVRYLEEVLRSSNRARELVAQMLLFSRSGTSTVQPLALAPLVKEVVKMLNALLPSSIELQTRLSPNLPNVLIEAIQIHQALINLCVNARDAMAGQGILRIELGWARDLDGECQATHRPIKGDWIELAVSDTGCGIDLLTLNHIFEPFFTTKSSGKGTGMGLAVVHTILEQHDARLLVETEPNRGTRFRLLFRPHDGSAASLPAPAEKPRPGLQTQTDSHHILVVDDEQSIAGFLRELLRNQGYRVTLFHDGLSAFNFLEAGTDLPDLLITDQTMPGLTGIELIRATRKLPLDIPIILCTGYSEYADEGTAEAVGAQAYFLKPVDSRALLRVIAESLSVTPDATAVVLR